MIEPEKLEVVYYSSPVPESSAILTFLGLVFDRVHFPNVYIPSEGFDRDEVTEELRRLLSIEKKDRNLIQTAQLTQAALIPELRDYCYFSGTKDQKIFGGDLEKAEGLVEALHEQIHGPFPNGFTPIWSPGYHKGLSHEAGIDYPADYYYQCNALLYSGEHGIPLINADSSLPVPSLAGESAKNNAKLLSSLMAVQCVNLVFPEMGELQPLEISALRNELSSEFASFRLGLLSLAKELNQAIDSNATEKEIIQAAKFVAQTQVLPTLIELQEALSKPQQGILTRTWELTKKVPGLASSYASLDAAAIPKTIEALGDWLMGSRKEAPRSNMYYLLKLEDKLK
ncbi:hypothetical protein [Shewanella algae]|uniref:Uncharacterized protein n=1 Tax=Shewanella algae TaxID=38313 RepID=A0A7T8ECW7_9GAMM|nr:hypothetical protein D7032_12635 [Shewanella algae]